MAIDLEKALRKKSLDNKSGDIFKFENPGDQLIFEFRGRQTETKDGRDSDRINCTIRVGEKVDPKTKKTSRVKPGNAVFYLQTDSRRIFDAANPGPGDVWLLRLVTIRNDLRGMKEYEYEILEKVPRVASGNAGGPRPPSPPVDDDNIPDFPVPKK